MVQISINAFNLFLNLFLVNFKLLGVPGFFATLNFTPILTLKFINLYQPEGAGKRLFLHNIHMLPNGKDIFPRDCPLTDVEL